MHRCPILLFGDFNVHVDVATDPKATRMAKLLRSSRCVQHVIGPTYTDGHTLDLIISSEDDEISDVEVGERISDHSLLTFTISFSLKPVTHATRTIRSWRKFNEQAFNEDLRRSPIVDIPNDCANLELNDLTNLYDSTLISLLDKHCPKRTVTIQNSQTSPCFDSDCRAKRRRVTMLQRRYEQSASDMDRLTWIEAQKAMHKMFKRKEGEYWRRKVKDN